MRRIVTLVAEELRGHMQNDQSVIVQTIEDECAKIIDKLQIYDQHQSSMLLHLL